MNSSKETALKVFGLILIALIPTLVIYLLLSKFVGQPLLAGKVLGNTIRFTGPIAFYAFIVILFRKWAVTPISPQSSKISNQEEIESMSELEKRTLLEEFKAQISSLEMQSAYVTSLINKSDPTEDLPGITQIPVDVPNVSQ